MGAQVIDRGFKNIIFDDFENCTANNYGRILNIINKLSYVSYKNELRIIFALSSVSGTLYSNLVGLCDKILFLKGLETEYLEELIKLYFSNDMLDCHLLSEYMFEIYKGNPGMIINIFKLKFGNNPDNNLTQNKIYEIITNSHFFNLDVTEERILLFLCIMPTSVSLQQIKKFLKSDPVFLNIGNLKSYEFKLKKLSELNMVISCNRVYHVNSIIHKLYLEYAIQKDYLVQIIYDYQKKNKKELSNRVNSDFLDFILKSNIIQVSSKKEKDYFRYTLKTACDFAKMESWENSVNYFSRILKYIELFDEYSLILLFQSFYYNTSYILIKDYLNLIDDHKFESYGYWFWKGNLYHMLNDMSSIECLDKAIDYSNKASEKLYAQIVRKSAMSELPQYCNETYTYYCSLLNEYEFSDFCELPVLYRNSLVMGGNDTILLCNKGIALAKKYNSNEELIRINHNKHFELFRMGKYSGCAEAFKTTADYYQKESNRIYEAAYGYNNLALLCLIEEKFESASLYAASAVLYAGTPYSRITTQVNYNLIESFRNSNIEDINYRVNKIEHLISTFQIEDYRIYRKSYFSIAISYANLGRYDIAIKYLKKSEPYLATGNHINRYCNLCEKLHINPITYPQYEIKKEDMYYNFYSNPQFELWLLAFGHL